MQILCALLLCLNLFTPQNPAPIKVKCVLVNLFPLRMACDDKSEFEIPEGEWPEVWHSQHLTGSYNAELRDGQMYAVETLEEPGRNDRIRANTLKEMRRWRIPPTQTSGRPE